MSNTSTIRYIALDVETTGFKAGSDEIISIALIPLDKNLDFVYKDEVKGIHGKLFHAFPTVEVPEEVRAINGYDQMTWALRGAVDQDELAELVSSALTEWGTGIPLGHNVQFDAKFVLALVGDEYKDMLEKGVCTMDLAKRARSTMAIDSPNNKLGSLCEALGIDLDNAHSAYDDTLATLELARVLLAEGAFDRDKLPLSSLLTKPRRW